MTTSAQIPTNQVSLEIDEDFRDLMPPLSKEAYVQLENSIVKEGCREPLVVWECDGKHILLDGHNRRAICEANNIAYYIVVKTAAEVPDRDAALEWILRNQLARRNLTPEQFRDYLGKLYNTQKARHGGDRKSSGQNDHLIEAAGKTAEKLAKEYGVSEATVRRAGRQVAGKSKGKRPAAPKEAEHVKDADGREIPAHLVGVFGAQEQFERFAQTLSTLKGRVKQAVEANPVAWSQFNENAFRAAIEKARDQLTLSGPFVVCSYCGGSDSDKCRACKGSGFLSRAKARCAPKELRS